MALGTALLVTQGLGALANLLIGRKQKREGRALAKQGRQDVLDAAGPTAELLAGVDEQKGIIGESQRRAEDRLDTSVAGFLDALSSGDRSAIGLTDNFAGSVADASSNLGLQAASQIASANQPLIDAAEQERQTIQQLGLMDLSQGTEAFNTGQQTQFNAIGQALGTPMDLASLQIANPDAFASLFPNLAGAEGVKIGQQGAYTGGGINMKTVKSLLDAMPKKEEDKDKPTAKEKFKEEKKRRRKRDLDRDPAQILLEDSLRRGGADNLLTELGGETKDDTLGKAMGGVMRPGDVFKTPGPEDHNKKEFDIVDAESGQTVARTTGQENHTINNDDPDQRYKIVDKDTKEVLMESEGGSMSVLNSDQSGQFTTHSKPSMSLCF